MKKILFTTFFLATLALSSPLILSAQAPKLDYSGFVKCDGVVSTNPGEEERKRQCDFAALMDTIIGVVNFLFYISIPIAVALFAYGGVLYMTGVPGNIKTATAIFKSVAIGFIIMITAWFAVRTVVDWFVEDEVGAAIFLN